MLFRQRFWEAMANGSVTLAFRRWKRPAARVGATHRTPPGVIEILDVRVADEEQIDADEARRAGFESRDALIAELAQREGEIYRIEFRFVGEDPRIALRQEATLSGEEMDRILERLRRFDASAPGGTWTGEVLRLIASRPAERAADLAEHLGRQRLAFKRDVRKLKELGLTQSLAVGYRLSPRGETVLAALERGARDE
jgi:hypothetical protein